MILILNAMKAKQILVFCLAFFWFFPSPAQDILFRKNRAPLKVTILNRTSETITCRPYENDDSIRYHIAVSVVDSILYGDGRKEILIPESVPVPDRRRLSEPFQQRHHRVGLDLFGLALYSNFNFSYEYLPGKTNWGLKAVYTHNFKWLSEENLLNDNFRILRGSDWYMKFGVNRYFPNGQKLQGGFGAFCFFGYYSGSDFFSGNDQPGRNFQGVSLNADILYHISRLLAFSMGCEYPVLLNYGSETLILHGGISINF